MMNNRKPQQWKECKLGDVAEITSAKRIYYSEYVPNGVPFFRSKEIIERFNRQNTSTELFIKRERYEEIRQKFGAPQEGDILLTSVGTLGIPCLVRKEDEFYFKDGNLTWFRNINSKTIDNLFLYFWIISVIGQQKLYEASIGSTQPALTIIGLKNIEIFLPSLPEQRAIAGVLSSLDDKIDLLHRQNKTLEGIAEALWRKMFVEEAKEEWEKINLSEITELQRGISYNGNQLGENGNGTPMHNLNSIDINGSYKYEGIKFYTGEVKEKQKLEAGDLLIINTDITQNNRIIGWPIFVPANFIESTFTHHLYSATLKSNKISKLYLYYLLRSRDYRETLASSANGTTVSMLSKEAICSLEIRIPPVDKRKEFEEIASVILDKQSLNHNQIKTLIQSRDTLLPKLMSGEVRVRI